MCTIMIMILHLVSFFPYVDILPLLDGNSTPFLLDLFEN